MPNTAAEEFVKTYGDLDYRFPTLVRHNGAVLAFAMDAERRIHYAVLDFGPSGSTSANDADHWTPNPRLLDFSAEIASVGFGVADQASLPTYRQGSAIAVPAGQSVRADELDAFRSTTARLTAATPFQVVSDGRYVHLFRQAITEHTPAAYDAARLIVLDATASPAARQAAADVIADHDNMVYATDATGAPVLDVHGNPVPLVNGTLLVDRYVLVGTVLEPKREVRFQRSRSRTRPAGSTDSLGASDLDGVPFTEPTQNLRFVPSVSNGRFAAVLTPTQVADTFRWQLFSHDATNDVLRSTSLPRTADGLFDTLGPQELTCTAHPDVYATSPGSCTRPAAADPTALCGLPLIARVGQASGTALSFPTAGNAVVTLNGATATGNEFTVEAWLAPDPAATGERALLTSTGDAKTAGPSIWLPDPTRLRIGFGDGLAFHDVTTPAILAAGEWNHVAVTFASRSLQVFVDGALQFGAADFGGAGPSPTPIANVGAGSGGYAGLVDDLRIWSVALPAPDIACARHTTLTGLEAGLVGYWQFDEGHGPTSWDAASTAYGSLDGPDWVTSDAPIAPPAGLIRSALRLQGRSVTGGLGAALYYQQENATTGYAGATAPIKQAARVMLAATTTPIGSSDAATVTALDFAVNVDGTLARLPGEVELAELDVPGGGPGTGADVLAKVFSAEADVTDLSAKLAAETAQLQAAQAAVAAADAALAGQPLLPAPVPPQFPDLAQQIVSYQGAAAHLYALQHNPGEIEALLRQQLIAQAQALVQTRSAPIQASRDALAATVPTLTAAVTADQAALASAQANLSTLQQLLDGDTVLAMPLLHVDENGLTTSGASLGFAPATDAPVLVDSALGRVTLYFRDAQQNFLLAYYDTFTGRAMRRSPADTGEVSFVSRSTAAEADAMTVTLTGDDTACTLVVQLPGTVSVTETWPALPRDSATLAGILNGSIPPVFCGTVAAGSGKLDALTFLAPLAVPLATGALLQVGSEVLTTTATAARGATSVSVEPTALTIAAGTPAYRLVYDYRQATSTRAGAALSGGSLLIGVDARSASGAVQLGDAQSLGATPSCRWFAAPPGTTVDFDGKTTSAGVLSSTAVRLDGRSGFVLAAHDELDITGAITVEAWVRSSAASTDFGDIVARGFTMNPDGEVYLRTFQGQYQIGSWDGTDHLASAPIPSGDIGQWVHLAGVYDGTAWRLYRNGQLLGSTVDPVGAVPVAASWAVGTDADGDDRFFHGDIDEVRIWNRPLGSQEITDGMSRRLTGTEAGLAAYLYMERGTLVDHDVTPVSASPIGHPVQVTSSPTLARLSGFDVSGDVSMEAWVHPAAPGISRVLVHSSDASAYGLAVRQRATALHFDGVAGHLVRLPNVGSLDITGTITIEAWVRTAATDGLRDIVTHGYTPAPISEVFLRLNGGSYQLGVTSNPATDPEVVAAVPAGDVGSWVHLAGVHDGSTWSLYRNGALAGSVRSATGAVAVDGGWTIGGSLAGDRPFSGDIDEVRLWTVARTADDIIADMHTTLSGTETGLAGVWRYDGTVFRDGTPARHDGVVSGLSSASTGPNPAYSVIATVGDQGAETVPWIQADAWSHVAATFEQFYGVQLASGGYLDARNDSSLNLTRDLTVEAGIRVDDLSAPQGIITRGVLDDGTDDDVPYALWVARDGSLVFAFEDQNRAVHQFSSGAGVVTPGQFRRVAVSRRHNVEVDTSKAGPSGGSAVVSSWDDIAFYADGVQLGAVQRYNGPGVGSGAGTTLIGRSFGAGSSPLSFRGAFAEVRLWNTAREAAQIGATITGKEFGLVAWWRMQDGTGNVVSDSKGGQDATLHGAASWVHTPDSHGSELMIYLDGLPAQTMALAPASLTSAADQFTLGALANPNPTEFFRGQLDEVRVWRVTRTAVQVQENLFGRLTGDAADLVAYYPFEAGKTLADHGLRGNDLLVTGGGWVLSTAPIGEDTPLARNAILGLRTAFDGQAASTPSAAEYAVLEPDSAGRMTGVMKRAYTFVDQAGHWALVTGFGVGELVTQWVGQAQFDPQLIGYIEGAPPVPSENLTVQDSYSGASSVALNEATTTTYTYASSRDSGFNATFELGVGQGADEQAFAGLLELEAPLGIGVGEIELASIGGANVKIGAKASFETSLSWLNDASTAQGTTQSRTSTLSLTGNKETAPTHPAVGSRFVPNNTGFALVQSQTADVYALRLAHTGRLVAYQMSPNPDIPKDYNVITFPIDPHYTKQGVLDGKVGVDADVDYPNAGAYSPNISYFKPIEAYGLKNQIDQQEQELSTLYAQNSTDPNQLSGGRLPTTPAPVKRDLVNTYVWTADGGQFAQTTATLDSYSESVGGSYHFQGLAGGTVSADVDIFGAAVSFELSAMFGGHLDLSVTKTMDSERAFEVDATAGGEQDITVLDSSGGHVKAPGKVDAYRWLTFYLAPRTDNHDAFFNQVVDPIWLEQSSDPAAAALRQARQDSKRPAAWRILHRVTYVSRVLAPVATDQQPLEQALAALDISSNYELIRTLEPFVRGRIGSYPDFVAAVRSAVATYLPDLLPHLTDIIGFLVLYYGVADSPMLSMSGSA
jgi:hypothetical protein